MICNLIGVIVPVYNTAPWLARSLDGICAQTYRNLEKIRRIIRQGSPGKFPDGQ